jgi:RNA polymerase sigma factor (sigma-70 family)
MSTFSKETDSVEALISQAAEEYLRRLARGEQPQVEEYASRYYPQIALTLHQVLPALELLRQLARHLAAGSSLPSQRLDQEELAQRVRRAVSQLPEMEREILLMRTLEENSFEEVALMLKIDPAAARKCHGRALLRLGMTWSWPA